MDRAKAMLRLGNSSLSMLLTMKMRKRILTYSRKTRVLRVFEDLFSVEIYLINIII